MSESGATAIPDEFSVLSKEWSSAGRKLGQPGTHSCVVGNCRSLAFVALRTGTGSKTVCFRHYTLLDESSDLAE